MIHIAMVSYVLKLCLLHNTNLRPKLNPTDLMCPPPKLLLKAAPRMLISGGKTAYRQIDLPH